MSEGIFHGSLVARLEQRITNECAEELDLILVDRPGTRAEAKPPRVGRFTPDVWAQSKRRIYLGEAKTAADLETTHSNKQLEAFLEHVTLSPQGSRLFLAVPVFMVPRARLIVGQLAQRLNANAQTWDIIGGEVVL